jgi:peroxiredoxin
MPNVSQPAPDFSLVDTDRNTINLSALRGQKVVLAFFPAAFTGVCAKELCTFRTSLADMNSLNATVLAISVDGPFSNGAFARQNELNFPVLSDLGAKTVADYGVTLENFAGVDGYTSCTRSVFVVDESGNISYKWVADNNGQEPNYDDVKAALA